MGSIAMNWLILLKTSGITPNYKTFYGEFLTSIEGHSHQKKPLCTIIFLYVMKKKWPGVYSVSLNSILLHIRSLLDIYLMHIKFPVMCNVWNLTWVETWLLSSTYVHNQGRWNGFFFGGAGSGSAAPVHNVHIA